MKGSTASSKAPVKVVRKKQEGWWTPPRKPKKVPGISEKNMLMLEEYKRGAAHRRVIRDSMRMRKACKDKPLLFTREDIWESILLKDDSPHLPSPKVDYKDIPPLSPTSPMISDYLEDLITQPEY